MFYTEESQDSPRPTYYLALQTEMEDFVLTENVESLKIDIKILIS